MVESRFKPRYWRHYCPADTQEQGDDTISYGRHYVDTKIQSKDLRALTGKRCTASGCCYEVSDMTVLVNDKLQPIRRVGGANLFPGRCAAVRIRCCYCKERIFDGHQADKVYVFDSTRRQFHDCKHAREYRKALEPGDLETRLPGCTCVWVNSYGEALSRWLPDKNGKKMGELIEDGPLACSERHCLARGSRE